MTNEGVEKIERLKLKYQSRLRFDALNGKLEAWFSAEMTDRLAKMRLEMLSDLERAGRQATEYWEKVNQLQALVEEVMETCSGAMPGDLQDRIVAAITDEPITG